MKKKKTNNKKRFNQYELYKLNSLYSLAALPTYTVLNKPYL